MEFFKKILDWLKHTPNRLGGEWLWQKSTKLYFWYREIWHFMGGASVSLCAYLLSLCIPGSRIWISSIFAGILLFVITNSELEEQERNQFKYKTLLDLTVWFLGFAIIAVYV